LGQQLFHGVETRLGTLEVGLSSFGVIRKIEALVRAHVLEELRQRSFETDHFHDPTHLSVNPGDF